MIENSYLDHVKKLNEFWRLRAVIEGFADKSLEFLVKAVLIRFLNPRRPFIQSQSDTNVCHVDHT